MTNKNEIKKFKSRLVKLNTQLIQIEKKLSYNTDYMICLNHQKCIDQIMKHYDQLAY
ncbi:hypothetical protein [Amphibacillus xylanus]|uniref:Uncharacterized protein n=1 Tax=Amphibacillus xylanus (strain ATCC 51415 / DSM 6626 / JCM 7361 / LMG 17667 / NBRC 15112 / Ep01) TaxID=698758 RepID=K0J7H1_AMPXN|nr:hypothetical protein [Amphibacillus xylanus]BAM47403.1 hypothetical protein AXY_12710 [Amphibacillus xylanus NBRC 15112]